MQMQKYEIYAKQENIFGIICKYRSKFVSLQCQDECLGYPGKFPERASRIRHYPILKQTASFWVRFCYIANILFAETVHHHLQESFAGSNVTLDGNFLVTREDQDLHGTGRCLEMMSDLICDVSDAIVAFQVEQHRVCLPHRLSQSVTHRIFADYRFQVEHFIYTFALEDEVSRPRPWWDVDESQILFRRSCVA
jgi:hypothetical protein